MCKSGIRCIGNKREGEREEPLPERTNNSGLLDVVRTKAATMIVVVIVAEGCLNE